MTYLRPILLILIFLISKTTFASDVKLQSDSADQKQKTLIVQAIPEGDYLKKCQNIQYKKDEENKLIISAECDLDFGGSLSAKLHYDSLCKVGSKVNVNNGVMHCEISDISDEAKAVVDSIGNQDINFYLTYFKKDVKHVTVRAQYGPLFYSGYIEHTYDLCSVKPGPTCISKFPMHYAYDAQLRDDMDLSYFRCQ